MAVHDHGLGAGLEQGVEVSEVARRLEDPRPGPLLPPAQHPQLAGVGPVRIPQRGGGQPGGVSPGIEHVVEVLAGKIVLQEGVALLGPFGGGGVDGPEVGHQLVQPLQPRGRLPHQLSLRRPLSRRHRAERLPEAQAAGAGVEGQQVVQQGRARAGQARHHDHRAHGPLRRLGPGRHLGLDEEAVHQVTYHDALEDPTTACAQCGRLLARSHQKLEGRQVRLVLWATAAGDLARLLHERRQGSCGRLLRHTCVCIGNQRVSAAANGSIRLVRVGEMIGGQGRQPVGDGAGVRS